MNTFALLVTGVLTDLARLAVDKPPSEDEIGAGWAAVAVFGALAVAVAFLGWSLTKHLRKARTNAEAGVFGKDDPQS